MHVLAWSFLLYGDRWRSIVVLIDRVFQNQTILWLFSVHAMEHFDAEVEQVSQVLFRFSRFSQAYRARLWSGLRDAQSYFRQVLGKDLLRALKSAKDLDQLLGRYVIHRHNEAPRKKLSVVKHALLGIQHVQPSLRGTLSTTWQNLRVWEEQRVGRLRPPLPVPLWVMMVGLARGHGLTCKHPAESNEWLVFSLLLELGLLCMLRPGELLGLKVTDVSLPGDLALGYPQAALRIHAPKNRRQFGLEQFVTLKHPNTIAWLRAFAHGKSDVTLWPSSSGRFSRLFKQLTKELKITECRFTPGSLRPGGATMFYSRGIPISSLRFMGRWTAERSLEHYIQQAMSTQILNKLSASTVRHLKKLCVPCFDVLWHDKCAIRLPSVSKKDSKEGAVLVAWATRYAELVG